MKSNSNNESVMKKIMYQKANGCINEKKNISYQWHQWIANTAASGEMKRRNDLINSNAVKMTTIIEMTWRKLMTMAAYVCSYRYRLSGAVMQ